MSAGFRRAGAPFRGMYTLCRNSPVCRDALSIGAMLFLLWAVDPFGAASNAGQASAALFYRIVAPLYPAPFDDLNDPNPFDDKTQIAVIVINDESLANMIVDTGASTVDIVPPENKLAGSSATWPPSMIVHNAVVRKIFESATPKALFIDFGFFDERDSIAMEEFARTLRAYAIPSDVYESCLDVNHSSVGNDCFDWVGRAPIFLPRAGAEAPAHLQVLKPLARAATALVSTKYIGDEFDTYNQYDLFDCATDSPSGVNVAPAPSAALAMYWAGGRDPSFNARDCNVKKTPPSLSIYWSDWADRGRFACENLPGTWSGRIGRILRNWLSSFLSKVGVSELPHFQTCPPHLSVSAHEFLADKTGLMSAVLHDRYVFYGGNFVMADDLIRPPTHDAIPGVYAHTMAVDNLLRGQVRYSDTLWSDVWGRFLSFLAIGVAAVCSAVTWAGVEFIYTPGSSVPSKQSLSMVPPFERFCFWLSRSQEKGIPRWLIILGLVFAGYAMCLAGVGAMAVVGFLYLDLPPINFVGIFSFVGFHAVARGVADLLEAIL